MSKVVQLFGGPKKRALIEPSEDSLLRKIKSGDLQIVKGYTDLLNLYYYHLLKAKNFAVAGHIAGVLMKNLGDGVALPQVTNGLCENYEELFLKGELSDVQQIVEQLWRDA